MRDAEGHVQPIDTPHGMALCHALYGPEASPEAARLAMKNYLILYNMIAAHREEMVAENPDSAEAEWAIYNDANFALFCCQICERACEVFRMSPHAHDLLVQAFNESAPGSTLEQSLASVMPKRNAAPPEP
jgi:hypothetical protein